MNKQKILDIKKILLENIETSTCHGIANIFRNKSIFLRVLWTISLIGSFGYCVYCLSKNFSDFFEYKTNIQIKYNRLNQIEFPAISFCNQYSFNINSKNNLTDLIKLGMAQLTSIAFQPSNILNYSLFELLEFSNYFLQNETINYRDKLEQIGFSLDFMLINCKFNSNECSKSDFERFYSPKYGFCYKFNGNRTQGIRKIEQPGRKNGLSLELYVGKPTIEYNIYKTSGIELFIHNWSSKLIDNIDSTSLAGGFETNIAINKIYLKKQPKPYSECIQDTYSKASSNSVLYLETIRIHGKYEQKECLNICYHKNIRKKCGCYDPDFFNYAESNQFCSFETFTYCVLDYRKRMEKTSDNLECFQNCPEECDSVSYFYKISQSNFPSPFYKKLLIEFDKALNESKRGFDYNDIEKYLLSVNIYFDEIATTTIEENPNKTIEQLVAEIGGFLGLCMGISFLTLMEILDIFIKIVLAFLKKNKIINQ